MHIFTPLTEDLFYIPLKNVGGISS